VLENLLENAVKFNGKTKKTVLVSGFEKDNLAGISIKDDGNGIPQEQKQKLFEEFSQIDEYFTGQVKGMGLGLAMCRIIIKAHNGIIDFESAEGTGSNFYFALPVSRGEHKNGTKNVNL
ncbi:MAG: HAMP domain-containing sensor histidine kinase, partial [Elusimicrobiota bacterium]